MDNQLGVNYLQVTAAVSGGNGGGRRLNMYGEAIGVQAALQDGRRQNLNFGGAAERILAMQNGNPQNSAAAGQKELYCYADEQGKLHFVDWKTGVQV